MWVCWFHSWESKDIAVAPICKGTWGDRFIMLPKTNHPSDYSCIGLLIIERVECKWCGKKKYRFKKWIIV